MSKEAYRFCQNRVREHYENFPVASLILPRRLQKHIAAVYAFAREADDYADETAFDGVRMERLTEWEKHLESISGQNSNPTHPVFIALKETIREFSIPISLFHDLLTAFKMDVTTPQHSTFDDILFYCRHSANPVGRIVLYIMGYPAPRFLEYSDSICTALQLANFWQDVDVDRLKNRIYFPLEDLERFGYQPSELQNRIYNDAFKRLIFFQLERTQELFDKGKPLCGKIPGRLGLELKLTWLGGTTILKKIRRVEGNVFEKRPSLTKKDFLQLFLKALHRKEFSV